MGLYAIVHERPTTTLKSGTIETLIEFLTYDTYSCDKLKSFLHPNFRSVGQVLENLESNKVPPSKFETHVEFWIT